MRNVLLFLCSDKVFALSPKAEELDEGVRAAAGSGAPAAGAMAPPTRQRSIITLSSQSNPTSPSPPVGHVGHVTQDADAATAVGALTLGASNVRLMNSFEEMDVIASNTRSIAALAAQRRSKVASRSVNTKVQLPLHSIRGCSITSPHRTVVPWNPQNTRDKREVSTVTHGSHIDGLISSATY